MRQGILIPIASKLKSCATISDKHDLMNEQGVMDDIFALIANGSKTMYIAIELGIEESELLVILKRNPISQLKYLSALTTCAAINAVNVVTESSSDKEIQREELETLRLHQKTIDMGIKATSSLVALDKGEGRQTIIVHNTQVIPGNMSVPPIPKEIENAIKATYEVKKGDA